jgi:hypothetical protein
MKSNTCPICRRLLGVSQTGEQKDDSNDDEKGEREDNSNDDEQYEREDNSSDEYQSDSSDDGLEWSPYMTGIPVWISMFLDLALRFVSPYDTK